MRLFLINLACDRDRLAAADRQFKRLGLPYERAEAVDGCALPPDALRRAVSRRRWWCANGRPVMRGEVGCALSHHALYRRMLAEGWPALCVVEDDVLLSPDFPAALARVEAWLDPAQPQVVLFSNHTAAPPLPPGIHPADQDMYAECYALTAPAAAALLRANAPLATPCDHWGRWVRAGLIHLYHASPPTAAQDTASFPTHMPESAFINYHTLSPLGKLSFKCQRLIGWPIDLLLSGRLRTLLRLRR